jgi:hypothetical protein
MKLMSDFKKNFWPMMRWTRFEALLSRTYNMFRWVIVSRPYLLVICRLTYISEFREFAFLWHSFYITKQPSTPISYRSLCKSNMIPIKMTSNQYILKSSINSMRIKSNCVHTIARLRKQLFITSRVELEIGTSLSEVRSVK